MRDIIFSSDSYKLSHFSQYPKGTEFVSSYIESRGGKYETALFAGLQMFLPYLKAPTRKQVNRRAILSEQHGVSFNRQGWLDIADLGYLPIRIQAVKEGTILPVKNVLVQLENTDRRFPWLTSFIESPLLRSVWYPTTVATKSRNIKNILKSFLVKTADDLSALNFMLHDFGARGVSSYESSGIGGVAHLFNFRGTDTLSALDFASDYYSAGMAGFSVDAMEHSTITSWGEDQEEAAYENAIDTYSKPGKIFSIVPDSYDMENAVLNMFCGSLKVKIETLGGRLVVRPDSGEPVRNILWILKTLDEAYGTTVNSKGFKVLPDFLRVLQGDGVNELSIERICDAVMMAGYSVENLVFGMGGELLQIVNRDDMSFAMKCNAIKREGGYWEPVVKNPKTDPSKRSKAGRQALIHTKERGWKSVPEHETNGNPNMLEDVWMNGKVMRDQTLDEIRELADAA